LRLFRLCFVMATLLVPPVASAADAESGRRLAESRCVPCHVVVPDQRKEVADAPPFDAIARKLDTGPDVLAFLLLHPHPRMNVMITRREAEDLAAYISTLAR
jgi:mono/diheme cytochrome c family protein